MTKFENFPIYTIFHFIHTILCGLKIPMFFKFILSITVGKSALDLKVGSYGDSVLDTLKFKVSELQICSNFRS